jgi:hydrogenase nickel incorporation protein HypA/HybF
MHELAIVADVIEAACAASKGARITRVVLEIGRLTAVLPDAVRFCFALAAEGTLAEGAQLEIVETPGRARCRACAAELELDRPFGRCACGNSELDWLAGEELALKALEVI